MCLLLQQASERFSHSIEAFCLMSNHIHLAVRVSEASVSKFMHYLAFRYAMYMNRKYNRVGHLFQGRFKSVLVDDETYLKELIRYIHLNPVRAKLVSDPLNYLWSSHSVYLGQQEMVWLSNDRILGTFHPEKIHARENFRKYVLSGIGIETDYDFKNGCVDDVIGDREFVSEALSAKHIREKKNIELTEIIVHVCDLFNLPSKDFCISQRYQKLSQARALVALLVRETDTISLEKLGKHIGKDASGLTKLANRLQIKSTHDPIIAKQIKEGRDWLAKMSGCQA
jgi:REP element-mobilizing transposase RayT